MANAKPPSDETILSFMRGYFDSPELLDQKEVATLFLDLLHNLLADRKAAAAPAERTVIVNSFVEKSPLPKPTSLPVPGSLVAKVT